MSPVVSGSRRPPRPGQVARRAGGALALLLLGPGAFPASAMADRSPSPAGSPPIRLVFRFDDYSSRSDTALERAILGAFAERGLPLTLGVVPEIAAGSVFDSSPQPGVPLSGDKLAMLREAVGSGRVEAALHGLAHQTVRGRAIGRLLPTALRYHSEFIGVAESVQADKIARGRRLLEEATGAAVETFIPPWNGYDENTLRALEAMRFRTLSAARRGPVRLPSELKFLPKTGELDGLIRNVDAARRARDHAPVVVALFHHYDFVESASRGKMSLPRLERLLGWVARQKDVRVLTLAQAVREMPDLDAERFYWNRSALLWQITPPWLDHRFLAPMRGVYLDRSAARQGKTGIWAVVAAFYGLLFLASAAAAWSGAAWIGRRAPGLLRAGTLLGWIGLLAVAGYAAKDREAYWGGVSAVTAAAGVCGGLSMGRRGIARRAASGVSGDL